MAPGQTDVDPRVPAISAVTSATVRAFEKDVLVYIASTREEDRPLCGPRIFRNLRGEALRLCEDPEVAQLSDANNIVKALRNSASEGQLRIIPRVYDALFRQTSFGVGRGGEGSSSMQQYLDELVYHRKQLEREDKETKVSDGVLGYFALLRSGLTERERMHVLGLSGSSYAFSALSAVLRDLYPEGSLERGRREPGAGRRGYMAEAWDDDQNSEWDAWTHYDSVHTEPDGANCAWSEDDPDVAEGMQALMAMGAEELTDDHIAFAASVDHDVADALVTMREGHARMNDLRLRRGFFQGTLNGTWQEGGQPDGRAGAGKSKGKGTKNKGSGKNSGKAYVDGRCADRARDSRGDPLARARGANDGGNDRLKIMRSNTRCLDCGRLGHWRGDAECPKRGEGGQKRPFEAAANAFSSSSFAGVVLGLNCAELDAALVAQLPGGMSVADTGCTRAVAGVSWLEDWAAKLKPLGLQPVVTDQRETFKGLGGAQQTSDRAWEFPVGLQGAHTTITFQEIAGDMPGLTAKGDLKRWGADMRFSEGRLDLVGLDRWNLPCRRQSLGEAELLGI